MPINVAASSITLDKVRIEQYTVSPQINAVMIKYSKGYNDSNGNYIAKEYTYVNLEDVVVGQNLYDLTKDFLYELLNNHLTSENG